MTLSISNLGVLLIRDNLPVWDDVLRHRQTPLTEETLACLLAFLKLNPTAFTPDDFGDNREAIDELISAGAVVDSNSARAEEERHITAGWSGWPTLARLFHFSSRTTALDRVKSIDDSNTGARRKRLESPLPSRFLDSSDDDVIELSAGRLLGGFDREFLEVLESRRTVRRFGSEPVAFKQLSDVLDAGARMSHDRERNVDDETYGNYFRNSPSGGARASTEVYVQIRAVDGVERGNYRYNPIKHCLEYLTALSPDDVIEDAVSDQRWFLDSAAILVLVADMPSYAWRYLDKRSYSSLILDAGHLNQNVCLAATALRLGVAVTGVQRDELWEREFGLDSGSSIVIMATGVGSHPNLDDYNAALPAV